MTNNEVPVGFIEVNSSSRFADIHILLVEDDDCDVISIKRLLSSSSKTQYSYTVASTIDTAIEYLKTEKFDICLLDYFIGSGNAWSVLDVSQKNIQGMPVILVSGLDDEEIDDQLALMGVVDCLNKSDLTRKLLERSIHYALHSEKQRFQLNKLAHYDSLTGLVNRSLFFNILQDTIKTAGSHDRISVLFYIDVDNFKQINDTWGHDVGDQVLTCVSHRIGASLRKTDTVARIGGDEFALIIDHLTYPECHMIAQKILCSMVAPIQADGISIRSTLSIGFALIEDDSLSITDYVKRADSALYEAKRSGKNQYKVFNGELAKAYEESLHLACEFNKAITNNTLKLYFHPVICTDTKKILSLEALLRWPFGGQVLLPDKILPVVERLGAMDVLTEWVIKNATEQMAYWLSDFSDLVVSVNIFVAQLRPNLVLTMDKYLRESGIPAANFQLEINKEDESPFPEDAILILNELSRLGVNIAFDNFGKNFSSMYDIAAFPTSTLKLNKSFIQDAEKSISSQNFLKAAINFAKELGIDVVGEGVETLAQQASYQKLGVHDLQGFLYSKPMDAARCSQYLTKTLH